MYVVFLNGELQPNTQGRQANTFTTNCIPDGMPVIEQAKSFDVLFTVHVVTPHALRASTLKNSTAGFRT